MICTCIICGELRETSEEHVIPDAIGGKIKIYNVCKECNEQMGDCIDWYLTDDDFLLFMRQYTGVKNRDNKGANIFTPKYGWHDYKNNPVVLKKGEMFGEKMLYDGSQRPEVSVIVDKKNSNVNIKYSGSDYESIVKKIPRQLRKEGVKISEEELKKAITLNSMKVGGSTTRAKHELIITWGNYIPCVLKIAYEICCKYLGYEYMNDEDGKRLQEYLYQKVKGNIIDIPVDLIEKAEYSYGISSDHLLRISKVEERVVVRIRLFGCLFFKIITSHNNSSYSDILKKDIVIKNEF